MSGPGWTIELRGLQLEAVVGVLPEERTAPQPLQVDLDVDVDVDLAAGATDELTSTVDYAAVCDAVVTTLRSCGRQLLETACGDVARAVLDVDPAVAGVTVTLAKLRPPVRHELATAAVRLRLER